jgi:hypothetical protein
MILRPQKYRRKKSLIILFCPKYWGILSNGLVFIWLVQEKKDANHFRVLSITQCRYSTNAAWGGTKTIFIMCLIPFLYELTVLVTNLQFAVRH